MNDGPPQQHVDMAGVWLEVVVRRSFPVRVPDLSKGLRLGKKVRGDVQKSEEDLDEFNVEKSEGNSVDPVHRRDQEMGRKSPVLMTGSRDSPSGRRLMAAESAFGHQAWLD